MNLIACDDLDVCNLGNTYFHESLAQKSLIDHIFILKHLKSRIEDYKIRDDAVLLSLIGGSEECLRETIVHYSLAGSFN